MTEISLIVTLNNQFTSHITGPLTGASDVMGAIEKTIQSKQNIKIDSSQDIQIGYNESTSGCRFVTFNDRQHVQEKSVITIRKKKYVMQGQSAWP